VWVFYIELYTSKQVSHFCQIRIDSINKKFCYFVFCYLTCHYQLLAVLVACGSHLLVNAFELYGNRCFFDTCETFFVDQLGQSSFESQHFLASWTEQKLDSIQNIAFAWAIESSYGIELGVEIRDDSSVHVSLEALQNDLLYVHIN